MLANLELFNLKNKTIAVALSGGSDSICLLHFLNSKKEEFSFTLKAVNVEHGIRGESSKKDSAFVKDLCEKLSIPLRIFEVDAPKYCKENNLSIEEGARALRYACFYTAIEEGFCTLVATAHHESDNFETMLFNLFRGTGMDGVKGIKEQTEKGIIRPLLKTSKQEINDYLKLNNLSFVTDESNFDDKYTRNYLRNKVIPLVEEIFPNAKKSVDRFSEIIATDNDYLNAEAEKQLTYFDGRVEILPCHKALFSRAVILALKHLGVKKDWGKVHLDDTYSLLDKENGKKINLLKGIVAVKEYDKIVLYKEKEFTKTPIPFSLGETEFNGKIIINKEKKGVNLKDGFYLDLDKIPKGAIIRTKEEGDLFTKFGGGTKSLGDYFTDKKIPLRLRDGIPLLAINNEILAIFGVAISDRVKVDNDSVNIVKLEYKQ
jgi:tRNA(Ile)-lysidine synthase